MNETNLNHQLCYFAIQNAQGEAMNLLAFGFRQLSDTYLYKNQETLKTLCQEFDPLRPPKQIAGFALNHLIDSIKIHICYENFLKGTFLANGAVVHILNRDIFPELSKKQKVEPIHRDEVVARGKWEDNPKIKLSEPSLRLQIRGIEKRTLGTNILTKKKYLEKINFNSDILNILQPHLEYRNNLHYYSGESFNLTQDLYTDLRNLINYSNQNIVKIHNQLIDNVGKSEEFKLKPI